MEEINTQLESKIKNSHAVKSMFAEMQISKKLKKLDWEVTDNPYYEDVESGKFRELDVFGRLGLEMKNKNLSYELLLLVESKSAIDFHVLFSNSSRFISSELDRDWLGDHIEKKGEVFTTLKKVGFSDDDIDNLFEKVRETFYPNDSWIFSELQYPFFTKLESYYSFRETNLGTVKELNNSVVWKAFLELMTVNKAIRKRHLGNMLEDLQFYIENKEAQTPFDSAFACIENYLRRVSYIQPVLVLDSDLWKLRGEGDISKIEYARLLQTDLFGVNYFWIDIVNRNSFEGYIEAVTDHTKQRYNHFREKSNG